MSVRRIVIGADQARRPALALICWTNADRHPGRAGSDARRLPDPLPAVARCTTCGEIAPLAGGNVDGDWWTEMWCKVCVRADILPSYPEDEIAAQDEGGLQSGGDLRVGTARRCRRCAALRTGQRMGRPLTVRQQPLPAALAWYMAASAARNTSAADVP